MLRAFPIGRLFGIRFDVHTSWLPIYALVVATMANIGPIAALGHVAAYTVAALAALALFGSVVVHEIGHALTARWFGVRTQSIALFLFGGVATLEAEPPTPLADALVALAGPAVSVCLAVLAYGAMHFVDAVVPFRYADAAASVLGYVIVVNVILAGFNLIPAYPMDGGRVFRAILWRVRGDRDRATATVALVGIAFGVCFAAGGAIAALVTHTWQFAWYVVVAAYLVRSCSVQYRALRRAGAIVSVRPSWPVSGVASVAVRIANRLSV
jgi:Zn-dependent protease